MSSGIYPPLNTYLKNVEYIKHIIVIMAWTILIITWASLNKCFFFFLSIFLYLLHLIYLLYHTCTYKSTLLCNFLYFFIKLSANIQLSMYCSLYYSSLFPACTLSHILYSSQGASIPNMHAI